MGVQVKLRCSECATVRPVALSTEQKELVCPVCGRRIQNLTLEELGEIEAVQKKQQIFTAIAFVFFGLSIASMVLWAGNGWAYKIEKTAMKTALIAPRDAEMGFMVAALVCGLIAMVVGSMASSKRFVVEF